MHEDIHTYKEQDYQIIIFLPFYFIENKMKSVLNRSFKNVMRGGSLNRIVHPAVSLGGVRNLNVHEYVRFLSTFF